jgi:hypothetical protein
VQALPSEQAEPFFFAGSSHTPVEGLQVPAVWHWSLALHNTGLLPVQMPVWQVSALVQALPSLQRLPLLLAGLLHLPVDGLHEPASWHWSLAVHTVAPEPLQVPA